MSQFSSCAACPHPADCAAIGECLDVTNARAVVPHNAEFMTPKQVKAVDAALDEGKSKRLICSVAGAIVSVRKLDKHIARYVIWGASTLERIERNRLMADAKKGVRRDACPQGHLYADHGRRYFSKRYPDSPVGRWYWTCTACNAERHRNPTNTPSPDLVNKVREAADAGKRISWLTKWGSPQFICSFRQYKAIRRLHPDIGERIDKNSQHAPRLTLPRPAIIRGPTLTGIIAAPSDPSYTIADRLIPRNLPQHVRRSAVCSLAAAIFLKEVLPENAAAAVKTFVSEAWRDEGHNLRFISLDAPAFRDGSVPLVERMSEARGLWAA
jgi:hypothetical protein